MRDQQHRLFGVIDETVGEIWLVVENQRDVICAGHVLSSDDRELIPWYVAAKRDVRDLAARRRTANRRAMQHVRKRQIVDVQRLTRNLLAPLFSRKRFANWVIRHSVPFGLYLCAFCVYGFAMTNGFASNSRR